MNEFGRQLHLDDPENMRIVREVLESRLRSKTVYAKMARKLQSLISRVIHPVKT
jgi:hypothetical protein